jgi:hypothetical protein
MLEMFLEVAVVDVALNSSNSGAADGWGIWSPHYGIFKLRRK